MVPKEAWFGLLKDNTKDLKIGQKIDGAMIIIQRGNVTLTGVRDKRYVKSEFYKRILG